MEKTCIDTPIMCQPYGEVEFFSTRLRVFHCHDCDRDFIVLFVKDEDGIEWVVNPTTDILLVNGEWISL